MKTRLPETALVVGISLLMGLLLHRDLLAGWGSLLPGEPGSDIYRAHWSAWLVAAELPGWPFHTERVHFPAGVDLLPFPALSLVGIAPLTGLFGPDVSISLLVIAYTAGAVVATWWLVRTLGGGNGGGLLAGALLATQPILGGALRDGTLEVLAVAWLPVGLVAVTRALQGSWRWGMAAGGLALCIGLESAYFGSFSALAFLFAACCIRSRKAALAMAAAGATALVGAGVLWVVFAPVIENAGSVLAGTGDDMAAVRSGNAASLEVLVQLALSPGSRGWRVSDLYGPPLAHWLAFGVGALFALRRQAWLVVLGAAYLLLSMDHPLVPIQWWADSPLGSIVRFPRRYLAAFAVVLSACSGLALTGLFHKAWGRLGGRRSDTVEVVVGGAMALYLGLWGAHAGGWMKGYPTTPVPQTPAFADWIAQDDEPCAALLLPVELPVEQTAETGERRRHEMPVFAEFSRAVSSSDQLFLQTRTQKAGRYAPSLVTLARSEGAEGQLAKNLTDLARSTVGESVPNSATAPSAVYLQEMDWLMGAGLKYVVVDEARYGPEELTFLRDLLGRWSVEERVFEDGTGVRVFRLYDQRPKFMEAPEDPAEGVPTGFGGRLLNHRDWVGRIEVVVDLGGREVSCPVGPEDGLFLCGGVHDHDGVWVRVEDVAYTVERRGTMTDATIRILEPRVATEGSVPLPAVEEE